MSFKGISINVGAEVTRGPISWNYIYVMFGFALAIESSVIQMVSPLYFPLNIAAFAGISGLTVYLFLFSGRFQNMLFNLKIRYENKAR